MYEYVFKWISYILVEVKSFPDGVAEICWKKPMDLRQMMMIHQHFRGERTVWTPDDLGKFQPGNHNLDDPPDGLVLKESIGYKDLKW